MLTNIINYSDDNWVRRMGNAILDKAEQGIVYFCEVDRGKLELIESKGDNPEEGEKLSYLIGQKWKLADLTKDMFLLN